MRGALSEMLLYLADRRQHLEEVIEPALAEGKVVISDRYHDATRAYQGAARGVTRQTVDALAALLQIREPDHTVLLDLDAEVGLRRARRRNEARQGNDEGWFEAENLSFHQRVRAAYLELAQQFPRRISVLDATGAPDEISLRIATLLEQWLKLPAIG
jgi:dTMP kinase